MLCRLIDKKTEFHGDLLKATWLLCDRNSNKARASSGVGLFLFLSAADAVSVTQVRRSLIHLVTYLSPSFVLGTIR